MAPTKSILRAASVLALGLSALVAPAFAQKTAYVASEEILNRLPEVREARTRLSELQGTWLREIQMQETDIARLRSEIEANRLLWSSQERRDAETRLKEIEQKLAQYRASKYDAGGEYEKLHSESIGPLYDKVFAAISEEARAQKYDFVFDKSSRGMPMLYASPDFDLTAAVLKRLGVSIDPAELQEGGTDTAEGGRSPQRGRPRPADDPNKVLEEKSESGGASTK